MNLTNNNKKKLKYKYVWVKQNVIEDVSTYMTRGFIHFDPAQKLQIQRKIQKKLQNL